MSDILFNSLNLYFRHFSSIDSMTEPHRFTAIMNCLKHIARQIVQQTPSYSQGQTLCITITHVCITWYRFK